MVSNKQRGGFNLVQVLLVIAIFLIIASISMPSLYQFQTGSQVDTVAAEIGQGLRRAQARAIAGYNNSNWGVYFTDHVYTIFSGDDYANRDVDQDEDFPYSNAIQLINDFSDEIIFTKITGIPSSEGNITISTTGEDQSIITINILGVIEYR